MESNNIELITRMVIQAINQNEKKGDGFMVPIGVSARHIHLTQEHVEALFGPGYQLTKKKELMGGQFASNETVTIVGLKLRAIENVRILGPVRKASQVEVSATDAIKLGMNVPVRESGDVAGSAPINIGGQRSKSRSCLHDKAFEQKPLSVNWGQKYLPPILLSEIIWRLI